MTSTRVRTLQETCPRCDSRLQAEEEAVTIEELGTLRWELVTKRCSRGCPLTVADFEAS